MINILYIISWTAIFFIGVIIGRFQRPRKKQVVPTSQTGCECSHTSSMHEDKIGKCKDSLRRPHYTSRGDRNGYEYIKCPCLHYVGPPSLNDLLSLPSTYPIVSDKNEEED